MQNELLKPNDGTPNLSPKSRPAERCVKASIISLFALVLLLATAVGRLSAAPPQQAAPPFSALHVKREVEGQIASVRSQQDLQIKNAIDQMQAVHALLPTRSKSESTASTKQLPANSATTSPKSRL